MNQQALYEHFFEADPADHLLLPVLMVEGEEAPTESFPTDAEQYIRQVRFESRRCEQIMIAKNPPPKESWDDLPSDIKFLLEREKIQRLCTNKLPEFARPADWWRKQTIEDFCGVRKLFHEEDINELEQEEDDDDDYDCEENKAAEGNTMDSEPCFVNEQETIKQLETQAMATGMDVNARGGTTHSKSDASFSFRPPHNKDENSWRLLCLGPDTQGVGAVVPSPELMLLLDNVTTDVVLGYFSKWIAAYPFSEVMAKWIYALLARIDFPLLADTMATLRSLCKQLEELRIHIANASPPTEDTVNLNLLPQCNVIIVILQDYFGQ